MPSRLARGMRVGDRYRLERELGRTPENVTWQATDERLDRQVALRLFETGLDRRALNKRAAGAASLTHPRVVRVFDTGQDDGRFFTVSELLPSSLESAKLPLTPDDAWRTALDVTEALAYAHERGVVHGNLYENNVMLSEGGTKVGDFGLSSEDKATKSDDLRALGELLRRISPIGQVGTPIGYTRIVEGLTNGAYASAVVALEELRSLRPEQRPPAVPRGRRAWLAGVGAALLALIAIGVLQLGEPSRQTRIDPGGRIEGTPVSITGSTDYDPLGDQRENPGEVSNATDGDPTTYWRTETYRGGPDFSGLKEGVGLVLDLGEPLDVGKAQVLFFAAGCSFELRYSDDRDAPVGTWEVAASVTESPQSAPIRFGRAEARYWLLWVTRLVAGGSPGAGSRWACAVADVELFEP